MNRELLCKAMIYMRQYNKAICIDKNEFVRVKNGVLFYYTPKTPPTNVLSDSQIEKLWNALYMYVNIDMDGDVKDTFKAFPPDRVVAKNGGGVITICDVTSEYRLMRLNDCVYFVADLVSNKIYIDRYFAEELSHFVAEGTEVISNNEFMERVRKHIADAHHAYAD